MATKPKQSDKPQDETLNRKDCQIQIEDDESKEAKAKNYAKLITSPEFAALRVLSVAEGKGQVFGDVDVSILASEMRNQAASVNRGDFSHAEAMLMNQATALQTLFSRMTERAMGADHLPNFETFMRMALRAQNQCRATIETLATIKNPPVIFAKQANIANGHQQINNGTAAPERKTSTRAGKKQNQQNELLEVQHGGTTMDTRAARSASGTDPQLEAVGSLNGARHR